MEFLKDRRTLLLLGGGLGAVLIGLLTATLLRSPGGPTEAPPASKGGLIVETGRPDDTTLDPARPLRCFVSGQFVGELTLADCARRNGVATGALDVGLDESGQLAGTSGVGTEFTPLPPAEVEPQPSAPQPSPQAPGADAGQVQAGGSAATCWRYAGGNWSQLPADMSLNACVQALYAGRCERRGGATYGRWGEQTLRLVPGRVEISSDNQSFRTLVEQGEGCALPPVG